MEKNFEKPAPRGRGSATNPSGRFERLAYDDADLDVVQPDEFADDEPARARTEYFRDSSASIVARNTSPDVGFDASINPYRGCEHGCVYCYARPTHEFLGLSAGLDFETKIFVKENAPELLRAKLMSRAWTADTAGIVRRHRSVSTDRAPPCDSRDAASTSSRSFAIPSSSSPRIIW